MRVASRLRPRSGAAWQRRLASSSNVEHCWDLLRTADYESYLVLRLAPSSLQLSDRLASPGLASPEGPRRPPRLVKLLCGT
eukprot:scaffold3272_cov239-Pinguiococcus_pyrenoidosus.AAC.2